MKGQRTALVLVVCLALFAFGISFLPSPEGSRRASVFSTEPGGRRAALLLLEALDVPAKAWTRSPGNLPRGEGVVFLAETPPTPPGYGDSSDGQPTRARVKTSRRMRDPQHYLRFLEEGGVIFTEGSDARLEFLRELLGPRQLADVKRAGKRDPDGVEVIFASGETLRCGSWGGLWFEDLPLGTTIETVAVDGDSRPLVLEVPVGRGSVYLLPGDEFLDNDQVGEDDNGLLLLSLLAQGGMRGEVLFDEYALGGWVPDSPFDLALAPDNILFTLHLFAVLGLFLWGAAWPSSFPRDPRPLGHVSPLARARAHGGLLESARAWRLVARMLRDGVLMRSGHRHGLRSEGGEPWPDSDEELATRLFTELGPRLQGQELERAAASLSVASVRRSEDLERWCEEFAWLETRLGEGLRPRRKS